MESLDVKPESDKAKAAQDGASGQPSAAESPRARNVAQTDAILGSPALGSPKKVAPKPPAVPKVPALNIPARGSVTQQAADAPATAVAPTKAAAPAKPSAPVIADAQVKPSAPAHDDAAVAVSHADPSAPAAPVHGAQVAAPVHGAQVAAPVHCAQVAVPAQGVAPVAAPAHGAAAMLGAQVAVPAQALPPPGAAKGKAPEDLSKMRKGQLARKVLEDTDVSGQDAAGQDRASGRGQALATAISKGAFQATADVLAGPSFDQDMSFQASFIAAWTALNKGYNANGAQGKALLEPILAAKFKGNKLGYLMDLREHGTSSAEWAVLLCLGEVEGGPAHEDAVVRAIERAAEALDNTKFKEMWAKVEKQIQKKMKHTFFSDARLHRVLAAKNVKDAEQPVVEAEAQLKTAKADEHAAHDKHHATEEAVKHSKEEAAPKVAASKAAAGKLQKANLDENTAADGVATETALLAKHKADAAKADEDYAAAEKQFILDTQALQAANQAHELALQALKAANRNLNLHQAEKAAHARASKAAADEAEKAGTEPKDTLEEAIAIGRRAEIARLKAIAAKQSAANAKTQIEKLQAKVTASRGTYAAAFASQVDAHDQVADHEKELRARQDKLDEAKATVEAAQRSAEAARVEAEKAKQAVEALEAQLRADGVALDHAKQAVTAAEGTVAQKKQEQLAGGTEVKYLATLVESLADKLNDFDREAIEQLQKWATGHKHARGAALAPGSAFLVALDAHIKKDRNKKLFKSIIEGAKEAEIKAALVGDGHANHGLGFDEHHAEKSIDEVTMTALVVDRETQKRQDKGRMAIHHGPAKIDHTILKQQVLSMSPEAREQYLAFSTQVPKDRLLDDGFRSMALAKLDTKFKDECGVVDDKERERMLALFQVAGAGVNYSKLYGLVHTTDPKTYATDDGFGKKALAYVAAFGDGEFHQLRQDTHVLDAIKVCTKKEEIKKLVGGIDVATKAIAPLTSSEADGDKAKTDALHDPGHWSTLMNVEMDKWRLAVTNERNRNDVYLFGHRAQQTALEVAKLKNPADKNAGIPGHADAQQFMKNVWGGLKGSVQTDMKSQYGDLAKALEAGGEVTLEMVLGSIAKWHVGSTTFHVEKADVKKTIDASQGKELLNKWSNIEEFKTGKNGLDPAGEREFKRSFVLDVNQDKRKWLDDAVGSDSLKFTNTLREKFKHAAEHDAEFKAGLAEVGYDNTQLNREKMEFRGLLEKASKQRKGWDVGGASSKGHVNHAAQREMVGGLRKANKDDQELNAHKTGDAHHDEEVDEHRDHKFEEEHAKGLDEKKEELELSTKEFETLRNNIRKYTEIAIGVVISIAITAATMGTVPAWAVIVAKIGAIVAANIIKEAVGAAIVGDNPNARKIITSIVAESAGTLAGWQASGAAVAALGDVNAYLKEFVNGTVTSVVKTAGKDIVKGATRHNTSDMTVSAAIKDQIVGLVVATAASQLSAASTQAAGGERLEHDKAAHEASAQKSDHDMEHLKNDSLPEAHHGVVDARHEVHDARDTAAASHQTVEADKGAVAADKTSVAADKGNLTTAQSQLTVAQQHLHSAQQHYHDAVKGHADQATLAADKHQLALAKGDLAMAQSNLATAHHALDADQARLASDQAALHGAQETHAADQEALATAKEHLAQAKENVEGVNKQIETLEAAKTADEDAVKLDEEQIKALEVSVGMRVDYAADKILDVPADIVREQLEDRHAEKVEKVTPEPKEKPAAPAATPHAPQVAVAQGHGHGNNQP